MDGSDHAASRDDERYARRIGRASCERGNGLTAIGVGSKLERHDPAYSQESSDMGTRDRVVYATATPQQRVDAIQAALDDRGMDVSGAVEDLDVLAQEQWVPQNGARVVAKAWTDAAFRGRLLANGAAAVAELGIAMPKHHRHFVVLENTPTVQNVICCTQCSCTAFTVIGLPPDWYKDLAYRSRVVRESRTVLKEMGLDLPLEVEIRVWDTTADTRYMVLPVRPSGTVGWPEEKLARIVTRDSMIGVSRL
jgi:nitrile hydratase